MKLQFLLPGLIATGLFAFAPDVVAHGGGGGGGHGGGGGFHGGGHFLGGGGFHGGGRFARFGSGRFGGFHGHGRFFGSSGFGFYGYGYGYPWWDWDYGYYPGPYYGDDAYYGGPSEGDQNPQFLSTRAVQAALAWRGYYSGRVDGVLGPETREAIRSFQAHQGLPVTGQIDNGLISALRR